MLFFRCAPCCATAGTLPEHGESIVLDADAGTLPHADTPGLIWTWLGALKSLGQWTGTFGVIPFLHTVLRSVFIAIIMAYQSILRPSMSGSCRFYPTCSIYAINAFCQHGLMTAIILIVWRIIRCNPWGQCGYDPVPSSLFSSS
jgi:putative membrane protein insertion efficiency factor